MTKLDDRIERLSPRRRELLERLLGATQPELRRAMDQYVEPRTDLERGLAGVWCHVLHVRRVGVRDNYFELGGDSILSIEIVARAQELSIPITARMLFDHPTIAQLAAAIEADAGTRGNDGDADAAGAEERERLLTAMQEGFLYDHLRDPSPTTGVVWWECHLDHDFSEERFREAWLELSRRHPVLRTTFHWETVADPVQRVEPEAVDCVRFTDLRGASEADAAAEIERCKREPFRLDQLPLVAVRVLRIGDARRRVMIRHQHVLLDGWSQQLLLRDLFRVYGGSPLDPGAAGEWNAYLRWLEARTPDDTLAYWKKTLAGIPLPRECASPCNASARSSTTEPIEDWAAVRELARRHRVTLASCIRLAWGAVVSRATQSDDAVFGATTSGRGAGPAGVDRAVGLLMNTICCRVRIHGAARLEQALRDVLRDQLEAMPHEWMGLSSVRRALGTRDAPRLFDSVLVVENLPTFRVADAAAAGLTIRDITSGTAESLPLVAVVTPDSPEGIQLKYDDRLVRPAVASQLCRELAAALTWMSAHPDGTVGDLLAALARHEG